MKIHLNPRQHLRITSEDFNNLRVRLRDQPDRFRQQFCPFREAGARVRGPDERDGTSALEDVLQVRFCAVAGGKESLSSRVRVSVVFQQPNVPGSCLPSRDLHLRKQVPPDYERRI